MATTLRSKEQYGSEQSNMAGHRWFSKALVRVVFYGMYCTWFLYHCNTQCATSHPTVPDFIICTRDLHAISPTITYTACNGQLNLEDNKAALLSGLITVTLHLYVKTKNFECTRPWCAPNLASLLPHCRESSGYIHLLEPASSPKNLDWRLLTKRQEAKTTLRCMLIYIYTGT
jgi:hypothetical protein